MLELGVENMNDVIGIISDTHGLLRPAAKEAMKGCDLIIHAGDVGDPGVLTELKQLAPVYVVRGNVDFGDWANELPEAELVNVGDNLIYVLHDIGQLDLDPIAAGIKVVVSGHSHQPKIEERENVLYFNPGSAGPKRFKLPVTAGYLKFQQGEPLAQLLELE